VNPIRERWASPRSGRAAFSTGAAALLAVVVGLVGAGPAGGCAPAARPATVPNTAVLEVANRTQRPQDIYLDGQRLGRVAPGERARFRALPARTTRLRAQPPEGGVTAQAEAALARDTATEWVIVGEGVLLPEPPRLGSIALTNALARDVDVFLDDVRVATLFAGEHRVLPDVAAGAHALEAVSPAEGRRVRRTLDVLPDTITPWTIAAPMGAVRVYNEWNEPAEVMLGGYAAGTVAAGELLVVPDRFVGQLSAEARGTQTRAVARAELDVRPGEITAWHLAESGGAVRVVNKAGEPLAVEVDGQGRGLVAPLDELLVEGLSPGRHVVTVGGAHTGIRLAREVRLGSGERAEWAVDPRFGAVRVVNTSPEPQIVYLDGERRADLPPGGTLALERVRTGPHRLSAVGATSRLRQDHEIHARAEEGVTWWLAGATGTVVVDNRRDEALRVFVDAQPHGLVEAGQIVSLEEVAAGERLLEAVGQESGRVFRERLVVGAPAVTVWTVRDPSALLVVENGSGEVLRTGGRLAAQTSHLEKGGRFTFRLPPGPRRVALVGADTGFVYALETTLVDGETAPWSVTAPKGAVVVWNRSGEPLRLALDGEPLGVLAPDRDLSLADVRAGRHVVQAEGRVSGAALRWPFVLQPEGRARWEVGPQLATVRVDNRTDEPLEVSVDGTVWGRVEPGAVLSLARVTPGPHAFAARAVKTGVRYGTALDVDVAKVAVWQVLPAEGTVLVTSARPAPMEVRLDGQPIGTTTGPGDPVTTHTPTGTRIVHGRALDERTSDWLTAVSVAADRTTEVHIPPERARVEIVNDTPWTVRVWLGDRLVGEPPAGTTLRLVDVAPRVPVEVRVITADGARVWRRSLSVVPREDAPPGTPDLTWRLLPPPVTRPREDTP
jgi:hypothetical protein